jgi:hypothetical protein
MAIPKDTTYPTILTQADWRKKKSGKGGGGEPPGIVPMIQSKIDTGLGAALAEAETAWKAIEWKRLTLKFYEHDGPGDYLTLEKANREAAQQYLDQGHVEAAATKLKAAKTTADAAAKAKLLSGAANIAAKNISTKLQEMLTRLQSVSLADFDKAITKLEEAGQGQSGVYRKAFTDYSNALAAVEKDQTKKGWDKGNLLSKAQEARTNVKQATKFGRLEFKPYITHWEGIVTLTDKANQVVGAKPASDKGIITKFLREARAKLKVVAPK